MFVGRQREINVFKQKITSNQFEFGLLYGRRRIGKTVLLKEITKNIPFYLFCR